MISYIDLTNLSDADKTYLIEKLNNIGYKDCYLNDFSFCPYLIIHKDFEDHKTLVYENINKGFLVKLISLTITQEYKNINNFISAAITLFKNNNPINKLF